MAQESLRLAYGPAPAEPGIFNRRELDLKVIFTDLPKTAVALGAARTLARELTARITLVVAQVVPYPLPLAEPDVPVVFTEQLLEPLGANVEIYLCRDRNETIRRALPADSLVILGTRRWRWWPSADHALIKMLRRAGCRVLMVAA